MKKLTIMAMAVLMAGMSLYGCSEKNMSEKSESSILVINKPLEMPDIDISIPEDYEETSTDRNKTVYVRNDASIIINSDVFTDEYKTLSEYVDFAVRTYQTFSDETEILSRETIDVNGVETVLLEYIYRLNMDNGIFSKYCMVSYCTDGEKLYLVTCKADTGTYENYREEFLNTVKSVKLK